MPVDINPNIVKPSVEEQAIDICYVMDKNGLNYLEGGMGTYGDLTKLFDCSSDPGFSGPENPIMYAMNKGWIINLYDENEDKSHMFPIKVPGTSNLHITFNSLIGSGIPSDVLGYKITNSERVSPRARIEKLIGLVNDYSLDLDNLNTELDAFRVAEKGVSRTIIAKVNNPDVIKLLDDGFNIKSNGAAPIEKQIVLKNVADTTFKDYSQNDLLAVLDLDPKEFSDELYMGKPPKSKWSISRIINNQFTEDDIDNIVDNWDETEYQKFRKTLLNSN